MKFLDAIFSAYLVVLSVCVVVSYVAYKRLDSKARIISLLVTLTLLCEILSVFSGKTSYGKDIVYHFYSIAELFLTTLYFLYCLKPARIGALTVWAAILSALAGGLNMKVQPLNTLNSNMLIFESVCIIGMSLFSLYSILLDEKITSVTRLPQFWVFTGFLFYWSYTFFFWVFFIVLIKDQHTRLILLALQGFANMLLYMLVALSFVLQPKLTKS